LRIVKNEPAPLIENKDVHSGAIGVDAVKQLQSLLDQKYKFMPKQLYSASLKHYPNLEIRFLALINGCS
jgi:hypothetical protein